MLKVILSNPKRHVISGIAVAVGGYSFPVERAHDSKGQAILAMLVTAFGTIKRRVHRKQKILEGHNWL